MTLNLKLSSLVFASALIVLAAPWMSWQVLAQERAVLPAAEPLSLHSTGRGVRAPGAGRE
jgi:hypothetical protein